MRLKQHLWVAPIIIAAVVLAYVLAIAQFLECRATGGSRLYCSRLLVR